MDHEVLTNDFTLRTRCPDCGVNARGGSCVHPQYTDAAFIDGPLAPRLQSPAELGP